jgi:8-oxo-dGTP pyrophosphatase MutT (NUDIX family)
MITRIILLCLLTCHLHGGVYLEKPADFNPKYSVVACCYLHYQDKILLLHRRDNKAEGNRWGIPGGKINKGEPVQDAIIREVTEETGYALNPEYVHHIATLYISVPNFDFQYHMFDYQKEINNPGEVKINFAEHKGFTWVTPQDALNMNLITDEDICIEITFGLTRISTK